MTKYEVKPLPFFTWLRFTVGYAFTYEYVYDISDFRYHVPQCFTSGWKFCQAAAQKFLLSFQKMKIPNSLTGYM